MNIPACKDCKHCQGRECHHPYSETVHTDFYNGMKIKTYLPIMSARMMGPCSDDGSLFEPLAAEILLNSGVTADGP